MDILLYILIGLIILFGVIPCALYTWVRMTLKAKNDEKIDHLKKLKGECFNEKGKEERG